MDYFVASDLFVVGHTEDGEAYTAPAYYVVAEASDGKRWAHDKAFPAAVAAYDDEYGIPYFPAVEGAADDAEALRDCIAASDKALDPAHWAAIPAAYGSAAHCEADHYDDDDRALLLRGAAA